MADEAQNMTTSVGTKNYIAPEALELLSKIFSKKVLPQIKDKNPSNDPQLDQASGQAWPVICKLAHYWCLLLITIANYQLVTDGVKH